MEKHEKTLQATLLQNYNPDLDISGISGERIAQRLEALSNIGKTSDGGSNRPGFSKEEKQAKHLVKNWMVEAGLSVVEDGAGNVIGRIEGTNSDKAAIASGSHVDTVPNGGHFDGTIGVLMALEVATAWYEVGYRVPKPFEVITFSDEEGSRFNSGFTGSLAMTGEIDDEASQKLTDYQGKSFGTVLADYGSDLDSFKAAQREMRELECFVEVHIEQGKMLENANLPVGIVSGIAGPAWLKVIFTGQAGHAGNTPMIGRKDPMVAASMFIQKVESLPGSVSKTAVATVGKVNVFPNGINVIPERVELNVDIRDITEDTRDTLLESVIQEGAFIAEARGIKFDYEQTTQIKPVPIEQSYQQKLANILTQHDITPTYIPSGAGHDAMILGRHIPVAMIFIRSLNGVSHHPAEWTELNDIVTGVHVLKDYLEHLMTS